MYAYITASTEWTSKNLDLIRKITNTSREYGFENSNEYLNSIIYNKPSPDKDKKDFHIKVRKRIKKADILIADISDPSVTLGTLIEFAIINSIKVLCLVETKHKKDIPAIIKNYDSRFFSLVEYDAKNIEHLLSLYLSNFKKTKIKLNVNISSELDSYMNWYSKKYHISKSDIVRQLLVSKMKGEKEYKKFLPNHSQNK